MACLSCAVFLVLAVIVVVKIAKAIKNALNVPEKPTLEEKWWGPRDKAQEDTSIKPFSINISDEVLNDLKNRLEKARPFVDPLTGVQHNYGLSTKLLSEIVDFWKTQYDWREREKFLNKFPQFTVSVQGLRIHYLHVKPNLDGDNNLKVLPLLLLHGWPGSVREFYEIIPILTTPQAGRKFVFEVFVPSLPGYGFSEAACRPGLGAVQMGVVFKNFMKTVGHEKFYVQGGDWGGIIAHNMSTIYPENVLGLISTICFVNSAKANLKIFLAKFCPSWFFEEKYISKMYPISARFQFLLLELGYLHLQATKPDTVGVALNDSPAGLASYILEKFITWTNPEFKNREDGGLAEKYGYTNLLDNVMIYWVTNSITTSMRLYAETFNKSQGKLGLDKIPIEVPTVASRFPHELGFQPNSILKEKFKNIVYDTENNTGGHFAAFELPEVLAQDIYNGMEKILSFNTYLRKI